MSEIVVYTALLCGDDPLDPVPAAWEGRARFVAFAEVPQKASGWEIRPLYRRFKDPRRNVRIHQILAHRFFPEAKYSIWMDSSVRIKSRTPLSQLLKKCLARRDLAVFQHRLRDCIYQEGAICLALEGDGDKVIHRQLQKYYREGHPYHGGLADCAVLLRRHTRRTARLNELWHAQIKAHSPCEQLSLPYAARRLRFPYKHLSGSLSANPHFEWQPQASRHSPRRHLAPAKSRAASDISLIFLYYDNPQMLLRQMDCWNGYASVFERPPQILLIDDGSPKTFAADYVQRHGCQIPIRVFRIEEDIAWNFTGARNLGCTQAKGWIYVSDIDTLLDAAEAKKLLERRPLDKQCFYMPRRVWLPDLQQAAPGIVNLLFHKEKYLQIGGYDEDYAGHYGREETDFHNRLKRVARKIYRPDVLIKVIPPSLIADARTRSSRSRDKTRNAEMYSCKEAAGFPAPVNPLRFKWKRVL